MPLPTFQLLFGEEKLPMLVQVLPGPRLDVVSPTVVQTADVR